MFEIAHDKTTKSPFLAEDAIQYSTVHIHVKTIYAIVRSHQTARRRLRLDQNLKRTKVDLSKRLLIDLSTDVEASVLLFVGYTAQGQHIG